MNAVGGSVITSYEGETGFRFYGAAFAAHLDMDTDRNYLNGAGIDSSHGSTSGMGYGIAARSGWEFAYQDTYIMPYGEIQVTKVAVDSYTETGGSFPATFGKTNDYQAIGKLGAQIKYDVTPTITVATRLAWAHKLRKGDNSITASSTGFSGTISSADGDKDWGELAIETAWQATEDTKLRAEISGRSGRVEEPMATITLGISTRF